MNYEVQSLPPLLKPPEVARILSICRAQAYRLIQIGEIPSVKILGSVRVRPEDLLLYIQKHTSK